MYKMFAQLDAPYFIGTLQLHPQQIAQVYKICAGVAYHLVIEKKRKEQHIQTQ